MLKAGTSDSRKSWFVVGDYKKLPNEVGGIETAAPKDVHKQIKLLLKEYNSSKQHTLDEILDIASKLFIHFKMATVVWEDLSCSKNVSETALYHSS